MQIWQSHTDNLGAGTFTAAPDTSGSAPFSAPSFSFNSGVATKVYDLGNESVLLNSAFTSGSGGGSDMVVLIPTTDFNPAFGNAVYLYSDFGSQGGDWQANSTFEEWGAQTGATTLPPNPTAILSGEKYNDLNTNGTLDASDTPLQGWTIDLYKDVDGSGTLTTGDTLFASTNTDASGAYQFGDIVTGIAAGNYIIVEEKQSGWTETPQVRHYRRERSYLLRLCCRRCRARLGDHGGQHEHHGPQLRQPPDPDLPELLDLGHQSTPTSMAWTTRLPLAPTTPCLAGSPSICSIMTAAPTPITVVATQVTSAA